MVIHVEDFVEIIRITGDDMAVPFQLHFGPLLFLGVNIFQGQFCIAPSSNEEYYRDTD